MSHAPFDDDRTVFHDELTDDVWVEDRSGPSLVARLVAEAAGTFVFILVALGVALFMPAFSETRLTVALAFGFAAWGVIVAIGHVSGAHLNPAVTVGLWAAGRFPGIDVLPYVLAQVLGASAAGAALWGFMVSSPNVTDGRAIMDGISIGFGEHSPTQFGLVPGLVAELVGTAILLAVVLSATSVRAVRNMAPATIGVSLTILVAWIIPFTNGALNPARATGTALFANTWALTQLWAWWVAPLVGAVITGLLYRAFGPREDVERVEVVEVIDEIPER